MVALKGLMKDEEKNLDLKKSMKMMKDVRSLQFNWKSEAWSFGWFVTYVWWIEHQTGHDITFCDRSLKSEKTERLRIKFAF